MKALFSPANSLRLLRIMISTIMIVHGFHRVYYGTIPSFGEFLNSKGFMIGTPIAWAITLFELVAGFALAINYFTKWITLIWAAQLTVGIILVHAKNGWFVVGASTGGVEFSLLIIASLFVLHTHSYKNPIKS